MSTQSKRTLIHSIKLTNFLSFGESSETIPLGPLNIIIGPNGSGKSNFLEAFELLRNAPGELTKPIREGGGVIDWLWKGGEDTPTASLEIVVKDPVVSSAEIRHILSFTAEGPHFVIEKEVVEGLHYIGMGRATYLFYRQENGQAELNVKKDETHSELQAKEINPRQSVFAQWKDPVRHPEITHLGNTLKDIRIYRDWTFGRQAKPRQWQNTTDPNEFLESDASNLGMVLSELSGEPSAKEKLLKALQALYEGIVGYHVKIEGGRCLVYFIEENSKISATRLSDGTLRYLSLLAILCHPSPPPLICIEEPELGLHPDILPTLAELLKEASERTQLIVTTHSDVLVDAMTDQPESVLVCEKTEEGSTLTRLDSETLKPWLEKYRLGELWTRGQIGGNRW